MDDPVAIALEGRAEGGHAFGMEPPAGLVRQAGIGREHHLACSCAVFAPILYYGGEPIDTGNPAMDLNLPPKVTDRAFARIAEINAATGEVRTLRVAVEGGGCSGFQYDIRLDGAPAEDDLVLEKGGVQVLVDSVSLPFLANAVIDFSEELIGARFVIENPNAASSCGCGTSFSI